MMGTSSAMIRARAAPSGPTTLHSDWPHWHASSLPAVLSTGSQPVRDGASTCGSAARHPRRICRVLAVAVLLCASAGAGAEDVLVVPPESPFVFSAHASRADVWNFTGHADLSGTLVARREGSEIAVMFRVDAAQHAWLPYLRDHGPPLEIEVDDYDAAEKLFPPTAIEALGQGKRPQLERAVSFRAYHYQIWRDGERVRHSVLAYE